jgi:hypothetical protein
MSGDPVEKIIMLNHDRLRTSVASGQCLGGGTGENRENREKFVSLFSLLPPVPI